MSKQNIGRIVAVLFGAVVLFGLEQGLYIAIPVAVITYTVVKVAIGLLWGVDERA